MSVRTLFAWQVADPEANCAPGRPGRAIEERWTALLEIARFQRRHCWKIGGVRTAEMLEGRFPVRLVQESLRALKQARRVKRARIASEMRVTIHVLAQDVLWSQDATHLGRARKSDLRGDRPQATDPTLDHVTLRETENPVAKSAPEELGVVASTLVPVHGEVLREVASQQTLKIAVGPPAHGRDVIALLERAFQERLVLPLVWATDNGPQYSSEEVEAWLAAHQVVHLRSLPRTPQHNAWSERGIRQLKEHTGLGKGVLLESTSDATVALQNARDRLDGEILRESLGWLTPRQAGEILPHWYTRVCRGSFYQSTCQAVEIALAGIQGARARRRAEREAILANMERFELIKRTRGGRPYHLVKSELEA